LGYSFRPGVEAESSCCKAGGEADRRWPRHAKRKPCYDQPGADAQFELIGGLPRRMEELGWGPVPGRSRGWPTASFEDHWTFADALVTATATPSSGDGAGDGRVPWLAGELCAPKPFPQAQTGRAPILSHTLALDSRRPQTLFHVPPAVSSASFALAYQLPGRRALEHAPALCGHHKSHSPRAMRGSGAQDQPSPAHLVAGLDQLMAATTAATWAHPENRAWNCAPAE